MRRFVSVLALLACVTTGACEDPARPVPDFADGGTIFIDSDPAGGRVLLDSVDTGELTPALIQGVGVGPRLVRVEIDSAGFNYSGEITLDVSTEFVRAAMLPLTVRCTSQLCLAGNAQFHAPAAARFAVNAAGTLFTYTGRDQGIVWPGNTSNSYAASGSATFAAGTVSGAAALSPGNAGTPSNYWAGRPAIDITGGDPYRVTVPAWITPPSSESPTMMRGIGIVQEVSVESATPDAIHIRVTWRNITRDSVYRALDSDLPDAGIVFSDVWVGFILDADIGAFGESDDDLVSYDADRGLVFAYDSDFAVTGFSGGWGTRPALVGLMLIDGPGDDVRLNAWPKSESFLTGVDENYGRLLVTGTQTSPANHPDVRIGYAPVDGEDDFVLSVAAGPVTLAPGDSVIAEFAVLLAAPVSGTFTSGTELSAGDPADATRPLADVAELLISLADQLLGAARPR
ncbi:MAG TPA: PEGA domain-containing protein [Longimicrobiales bacterium]